MSDTDDECSHGITFVHERCAECGSGLQHTCGAQADVLAEALRRTLAAKSTNEARAAANEARRVLSEYDQQRSGDANST